MFSSRFARGRLAQDPTVQRPMKRSASPGLRFPTLHTSWHTYKYQWSKERCGGRLEQPGQSGHRRRREKGDRLEGTQGPGRRGSGPGHWGLQAEERRALLHAAADGRLAEGQEAAVCPGEKQLWLGVGWGQGGKKKWLDFRCILKVEPLGFADKLGLGCESRVKDDQGVWSEQVERRGCHYLREMGSTVWGRVTRSASHVLRLGSWF